MPVYNWFVIVYTASDYKVMPFERYDQAFSYYLAKKEGPNTCAIYLTENKFKDADPHV